MSAEGRRLYEEWRRVTPADARLEDVDTVIATFFTAQQARTGGKEPRVIEHCWLKVLPGYTMGVLSIAAVKGRKVKPIYVRRLVKAIGFIEWVKTNMAQVGRTWPEDQDLDPAVGERYEDEQG